MLSRSLGNTELVASNVVFGAWAIGGWKWGGTDADESIAAIRAALDAGINCIDTAAVYGFGLSERLVGKAIEGYAREEILVATKCGLRWDIETPTLHAESEGKRIFRTLTAESIHWEVDQSLERLGTDYIDLYQTHWPDPETPATDVLNTFEDLMKSGKVRAVGFCNSTASDIALGAASVGFCTDQEKYSALDQERNADNLPVVQEHGLSFLAYSPLAQGLLTGTVTANRQFPETDLRSNNPRFSQLSRERVAQVVSAIDLVAKDYDVSIGQATLAWTLQQPGVSHVLAGTRSVEQAKHNAAAGDVVLGQDALAAITQAAKNFAGFEVG